MTARCGGSKTQNGTQQTDTETLGGYRPAPPANGSETPLMRDPDEDTACIATATGSPAAILAKLPS
jgi:hypothetical protein